MHKHTQNNKWNTWAKRYITYNYASSLFPLKRRFRNERSITTNTHDTNLLLLTSTSNVLEFEEDSKETNRQRRCQQSEVKVPNVILLLRTGIVCIWGNRLRVNGQRRTGDREYDRGSRTNHEKETPHLVVVTIAESKDTFHSEENEHDQGSSSAKHQPGFNVVVGVIVGIEDIVRIVKVVESVKCCF